MVGHFFSRNKKYTFSVMNKTKITKKSMQLYFIGILFQHNQFLISTMKKNIQTQKIWNLEKFSKILRSYEKHEEVMESSRNSEILILRKKLNESKNFKLNTKTEKIWFINKAITFFQRPEIFQRKNEIYKSISTLMRLILFRKKLYFSLNGDKIFLPLLSKLDFEACPQMFNRNRYPYNVGFYSYFTKHIDLIAVIYSTAEKILDLWSSDVFERLPEQKVRLKDFKTNTESWPIPRTEDKMKVKIWFKNT
ncbi:hypothetical protein BpHYR1_022990 [Brachionus plicatilis]|uniref:Uncharacterized protein n=1 Tax=Brachionus plicatilis TaxID=10195 RepID=A0A3M7QWK2_BRAPC|nr:hypothetical protein BpHYR1_022990 [Brachionus plicatilis]